MKYTVLYSICMLALIASCKKGGSAGDKEKKIVSTVVNNINHVFSYDAQGRLERIDYGVNHYLLVEYKAAGIVLQKYNTMNNPLPNSRYEFNLLDGRIISGRQSWPNNMIINHAYVYDNEGRLTTHIAREVFEPTNEEGHRITFTYSYAGNNVSKATYLHLSQGERRDSIVITQSYHTNKKFFTWQSVGFSFFGTAGAGMSHQGSGIPSPVSGLLPFAASYPSANPLKESIRDSYGWNTVQNKWVYKNTDSYTIPETDYQNDGAGNLIAFGGASKIEWK